MKPAKIKEARKVLAKSKCVVIRMGKSHEIWQREDRNTFALPISGSKVSPGVMRSLIKFVGNK